MKRAPWKNACFLFFLFLEGSCQGNLIGGAEFQSQGRDLKLQCAPGITKTYDDQGDLDIPESRFAFLSFGNEGRNLIKLLRRRDESFYKNVVNQIIMVTCNVAEREPDRCVPATSEFAAKDWNNTCIQAAGYSCDEGLCERTSNCFWSQVEEGKVRTSRFPKEDYEAAEEKLYGYAGDVATLAIVGISTSIALLVFWVVYFVGRYLCCCLWTSCICKSCSPIPKSNGYNVFLQWIIPSMIYFIGFVGMIISGCFAVIGNADISVAATSCFVYVSLLVDNLGRFLDSSSEPLVELKNIAASAADDAFLIFNDTNYVRTSANEIIQSFADFMDLHVVGLSGNEGVLTSIEDAFSANVEPVVDQIQEMLDTLESDVYKNSDMINDTITAAVSDIGTFGNITDTWQTDISEYEQIEDGTRIIRHAAILSLFVIGSAICFAGFIGICTSRRPNCYRLHNLMNLAGIFSALLGSVCLVLASSTLLISFLWHDVCEISSIIVGDFEPVVGETIALGANAIFDGDNLAAAFNVSDKIDFEKKLKEGLSVIEDVNITRQFELVISPLEDMQNTVVDPVQDFAFETLKSDLTGINVPGACTFDYKWRRMGEWDDMKEPWMRTVSISGLTSWSLNSTGAPSTYDRVGDENPEQYINRIYAVAGKCDISSGDCCLNNDCSRIIDESCNHGSDCKRNSVCSQTSRGIREVFEKVSTNCT